MATFDFTLDETSVGEMLTPEDGHVTALAMATPPPYETPEWDEGRRVWNIGHFVLRGQHDVRDLICVQPAVCGHAFSLGRDRRQHRGRREPAYRGGLIVVAVPKNSQWTLTLSDVPNPPRPGRRRTGAGGTGPWPLAPPGESARFFGRLIGEDYVEAMVAMSGRGAPISGSGRLTG